MSEPGLEIDELLLFLIDLRAGWDPSRFKLIEMVSLAGSSPAGKTSLDPLTGCPGVDLAHRMARLECRERMDFAEGLRRLERAWRLPLIKAYGGLRGDLPQDCALIPTRPLEQDSTGHFEQMKFVLRREAVSA